MKLREDSPQMVSCSAENRLRYGAADLACEQMQPFPQSSRYAGLLRTFFGGRRRVYTVVAFITITIFLFSASKSSDDLSLQSLTKYGDQLGIPGKKYKKEDEWKVPKDWDPVIPVYEHFDRYAP
jgi:hypothetical protein